MTSPFRGALLRLAWRLDTPLGLVDDVRGRVRASARDRTAGVGFYFDLHNVPALGRRAGARSALHRFYDSVAFADYPPGYLYVLWVIGKLSATPGYLL